MATKLVSDIVTRASTILQDTTNVRWPTDELVKWVNDAQLEIVKLVPDAYTKSESVQLVPGTKQSLPASGIRLIEVVRNMGGAGSTPGRAVRKVPRMVLDTQHPDWHSESDAVVKHYIFDTRDPKRFYVYPGQPSPANYVELVYSAAPPAVAISDVISIDDVYANSILHCVLYFAYLKDADYAANDQRAANAWQVFLNTLQGKTAADETIEPSGDGR